MIKISRIEENGFCFPQRDLTEEEQATVIARGGDNDYIYFQIGDEETEEYKSYIESQKIDSEVQIGSAAFEAFKQCTDEEKRIIAQSLKEFL